MTKYRRNKARVFVKDVRRYGEYLRLGLPRVVVIFWKNNPKRIAITKQQTEDAKNYLRWLTFQSKEYTDAIQKEDDEDEDIYYIGDEDIYDIGDEYMSCDVDDDDYDGNEQYISLIEIFKSHMPAIYNKIHDMLTNIRKLQSLITKANNDIVLRQQHNLDLNGMLSYVSRWQFKVKQFNK